MSEENQRNEPVATQTNGELLSEDALDQVSGGGNGQGGSDVIIGSPGLLGRDSQGSPDLTGETRDARSGFLGGVSVATGDFNA